MGLTNAGLTLLLTKECEISKVETSYSRVPQDEDEVLRPGERFQSIINPDHATSWHKRIWTGLSGRLSQISAPTLTIMYKLWLLLAVDSLADGMVSSLTSTPFSDL